VDLLIYSESDFTVKQIAEMMDVSVRTVERRLQQFGLQIHAQYSTVSDVELKAFVQPLLIHNPQLGKLALLTAL